MSHWSKLWPGRGAPPRYSRCRGKDCKTWIPKSRKDKFCVYCRETIDVIVLAYNLPTWEALLLLDTHRAKLLARKLGRS